MKVNPGYLNPEYLSFTTYQSNSGMPMLVAGAVILIIALCFSVLVYVKVQDGLMAVLFFCIGAFMATLAFGTGSAVNSQIRGNIQEIETATGAQIISIDDSNVSDSHGDVVIGKNNDQVNLTKNVSYIKDGKVYTNGVIVITQGRAGLFNNEKELQPILAKK